MPAKRKTKREKYVDPVKRVIEAAEEVQRMKQEQFGPQLILRLAAHNADELVPAMVELVKWAMELQKDANDITARVINQARKQKGGKRG